MGRLFGEAATLIADKTLNSQAALEQNVRTSAATAQEAQQTRQVNPNTTSFVIAAASEALAAEAFAAELANL